MGKASGRLHLGLPLQVCWDVWKQWLKALDQEATKIDNYLVGFKVFLVVIHFLTVVILYKGVSLIGISLRNVKYGYLSYLFSSFSKWQLLVKGHYECVPSIFFLSF